MSQPARSNKTDAKQPPYARTARNEIPGGAGGSARLGSGRAMPESLAAEAAVLGSMLIDPQSINLVVEKLRADDFYRLEHRHIFHALIGLYEKNRGDGIDAVLLRDELQRRAQLEDVGGVEYLAKIMESVPSSANVMYYCGIVKDKSLLRDIITSTTEILDDAYSDTGEISEKLDRAEQKIFTITNERIGGAASSLKDLVVQTFEMIEQRSGKHVTGLGTGFFELDEMTCGLQNGEMLIVAGRPSMGKTSFAMNLVEHVGVKEKQPVAIFSLEMGREQLAERFMCSNSGIESQLVRKGMLDTAQYQKLLESCSELSEAPIYIDDTAGLTPLEIRSKSRRLKSQYGINLIVIDYLQLMSLGTGRIESRQQEITTISRYLKALARELNVPVIVLSQLNRAAENRENHRPRMSDLRESGSIEQDADVIMLLHREDYYHRGEADHENDNIAELIIAKQRNGPTGTVKMLFREQSTRFENLSYTEEPF